MFLSQHPNDNILKFLCAVSLGDRNSHPVSHLQLEVRYGMNMLHEPAVNAKRPETDRQRGVSCCELYGTKTVAM